VSYAVKEIYFTLQGEGAHTGRPAVFLRFAGCNLWTGREADRAGARCNFCDTDFVGIDGPGGGSFATAAELAHAVDATWRLGNLHRPHAPDPLSAFSPKGTDRFVVCTGGEPLLQLDDAAVDALHQLGFRVAVETNGTQTPPAGLDWICVSPKAGVPIVLTTGHELKFIYPQAGADPGQFSRLSFEHFFLQPMDGPGLERNTDLAIRYCLEHPPWQLSIQTHKYLGIP
jgi:7-carboxy-7-deazaguanine synthase (Cx14CxxC type)